jgi:D-threo-aldose 1-dehydrogenase
VPSSAASATSTPLRSTGTAALRDLPTATFTLSTKAGRLLRNVPGEEMSLFIDASPLTPVFDFSYDGVRRSLEESLERLGLPHVDVLLLHDPDDHLDEALSDGWRAMQDLRRSGIVKAIGAGMNQWQALQRFAEERDPDVLLLAGRFSLLDRSAGETFLPACADRGISVVVGGALNSGILANPIPGATYDYAAASPEVLARAQQLARACERHGVSLVAAALQFPARHPAVASVVVGARSPEEVDANVDAFVHPVPDALWQELEGLRP